MVRNTEDQGNGWSLETCSLEEGDAQYGFRESPPTLYNYDKGYEVYVDGDGDVVVEHEAAYEGSTRAYVPFTVMSVFMRAVEEWRARN